METAEGQEDNDRWKGARKRAGRSGLPDTGSEGWEAECQRLGIPVGSQQSAAGSPGTDLPPDSGRLPSPGEFGVPALSETVEGFYPGAAVPYYGWDRESDPEQPDQGGCLTLLLFTVVVCVIAAVLVFWSWLTGRSG